MEQGITILYTGKLGRKQSSHIQSIRPKEFTRESKHGSPSDSYLG